MVLKVTQIVELTQGELNNQPIIDRFSHIALDLFSLRRGGLFFAINPDEIEQAVALGAYGIIYENFAQMIDPEIAWIKVNNIQESIARLTRYILLHRHIEVFYLKPIELEIFKQICNDDRVLVYNNDMIEFLDSLSRKENIQIIISGDENFLNKAIELQRAIIPQEKPLSIHIATLFDMRIYYKLLQFHLRLPALFFDSLCSVVHLCQTYEIGFDLMRFEEIASVMPVFVDSVPNLLEYGQSERVLIAQKELSLFREYSDYIAQNGKWGKLLLFVPKNFDFEFKHSVEFYDSTQNLLRLLGDRNFNFGLILGIDKNGLLSLLDRPYVQPSLFG